VSASMDVASGVRTFRPRTICTTDCSSQIVQKLVFHCLLEAGFMK